jgi:PAS domain S-box-containing protein
VAKNKRAGAVVANVDAGALRAQAILDNARDAIISIDPDGIVTHFNLAAEKMFRYDADEVIGRNVSMLMPSPYREEHDRYIASYRETGEAKAIGRIREVEARRKDGVAFPIELSVAEIETLGESSYTAIIRDVTPLRQLVDALQQERDFSDRLLDTAPILVLLFDTDARVLRFNRYMQELTGYSLEEVQGQDGLALFVAREEVDDVRRIFRAVVFGQPVIGYLVTIVSKDGRRCTVSWSGTPLRDHEGTIGGVLAAGEDVSERIHAEAELRRLEKLTREQERLADVGAIAARLVHDLGNPVSGLSMQAHHLSRRPVATQRWSCPRNEFSARPRG